MTVVPSAYKGREQSYIKHIILERYLEGLAYKALFAYGEFNFLDAFSGPWQSVDGNFQDTSFMKAIEVLRRVQRDIRALGKPAFVRCIFIEKSKKGFEQLKAATQSITDVRTVALNGSFEDLVPEILTHTSKGFLLAFIDPKGWTGFSFEKIQPLISRQPNEVLINFMYDFIGRFIEHEDARIRESLDKLFGSKGWPAKLRPDRSREEAVVGLFSAELKDRGRFQYVVSTPIMKPTKDRTLYHLVFATRHPEGIKVYRDAERRALRQQLDSREQAKLEGRLAKKNQGELLTVEVLPLEAEFQKDLEAERSKAGSAVLALVAARPGIQYCQLWPEILINYRLRAKELHEVVAALRKAGSIAIQPWKAKQRVPDETAVLNLIPGNTLV